MDHSNSNQSTGGIKDKAGKMDPALIPFNAIKEIVKIREFGNAKYSNDTIYLVPPRDLLDAAFRHIMAIYLDRDNGLFTLDNESNMPHISHALTNLAAIVEILSR